MYRYFYLVPLFSGAINLLLAIFVVGINPKRRLNQIFFLTGFGLAWWNFGTFWLSKIREADPALHLLKTVFIAVILFPPIFLHFAIERAQATGSRLILVAAYLIAFVFLAADYFGYFIINVRPYGDYFRAIGGNVFRIFFVTYFPIVMLGAVWVLTKYVHTAPPGSQRSAKFLLASASLLTAGGIHDMLPILGFDYYPGTHVRVIIWGTLAAAVYGLLIGYSILNDQLLEVRISISRYAANVLRLSFLGGIAYLLMHFVGAVLPGTFTVRSLIAAMVVLLFSAITTIYFFPKLFGAIARHLDQRVLGDHFEYQDKVIAFIQGRRDFDASQAIIAEAAGLVFNQLSLSSLGLVVVGNDPKLSGSAKWPDAADKNWGEILANDSPVFGLFKSTDIPHFDVRDEVPLGPTERAVRAFLDGHGLEVAVPLRSQSKTLLGLMVVGPRRDGRQLTKSDVELLEMLSTNVVSRVERIAAVQNVKLRQSNEAKDQFLASVNHEIRNPLNGINGIVRMLMAQPSDARSTYLLSALAACSDQLGSTMDDVLDFTQIESGTVTIVTSEVDLVQLVKTTCASQDISGTRLVVTDLPKSAVLVRCDSGKVRQILSNYCANALKYGVPIGAQITLTVENVSNLARVTLCVASTGPTLGSAELSSLFTALTRGRRARETNAHGAGLGLAVCKRLAHAMGGTVGVESFQGKTTFWFKADFPAIADLATPVEAAVSAFVGRRALAIEDESYNRLVLGNYLGKLQISTVWAENGAAALAIARDQEIDVILMDWLLPDMEGAELLQKMKDVCHTRLPPVIVLTAYSTADKRAACLAAGAVAFISKPVDLAKLTIALGQCNLGKRGPLHVGDQSPGTTIDLSPLAVLGTDASVINSFHQDVVTGRSRLSEVWRQEPKTAALLAHRLKAQMLLVRARESASLLELLEQALTECWATDDINRLVENADLELNKIIDAIRVKAGLGQR